MESEDRKRTHLPDAEAEGAENFGAEAAEDQTADSETPVEDVAIRSEEGTLGRPEESGPDSNLGELTGGETPEEIAERRADSEREATELEQEYEEPGASPDEEL